MTIMITDDVFDTAERLLRLPSAEWRSQLCAARLLLRSRGDEPEFVPDQHARARALVERITAALEPRDRIEDGAHCSHAIGGRAYDGPDTGMRVSGLSRAADWRAYVTRAAPVDR